MFQVIWVKVCFLEQRLDKRSFKHTLGHTPDWKGSLMMKVIAEALCSHNYTREVGIGFKSHDLSGIFNHYAENSFFRNWRKHRQTGGYIWWDRMNMTAGYGVKFLVFEEVGKFLRELWVRDVDGKRCWDGFSKMNIRDGEHFSCVYDFRSPWSWKTLV